MKEWSSAYNPFNSAKALMWREHLEACSKDNYLIPVTVDIDPSSRCNLKCIWCNAFDIIHSNNTIFPDGNIPEKTLIDIADMLSEWGKDTREGSPKSACVAGGGEPLMNPGTMALLERMKYHDKECGLITNGTLLKEKHIPILAKTCRWVGFSMDSATPETWAKVKGISKTDIFYKVIENIEKLTSFLKGNNYRCDVSYKYLIHPDNYHEIYDAAVLARDIGIKDFHMRPVGWDNLTVTQNKDKLHFENIIKSIDEQIEKAMLLENKHFKVYGVRHKFTQDFSPHKPFRRCWAIPILPTFGADGYVHTCFDMRGRDDLKLCTFYPDVNEIQKIWNTEKHRNIIKSINIDKCPRCTFTAYNEMVETAIINDTMCYNFP